MTTASDQAAVAAGRAAWGRLRARERTTWDDWLAVGRALVIGREIAMALAKTNRPVGATYNRAMGEWLRQNGFDSIVAQERYRLLLIVENLPAIETWRGGLDDAKRRRLNHPNAVWHTWRRGTQQQAPNTARHVVQTSRAHHHTAYGRAIYWPGQMLERAATAIRECRSVDCIVLAKAALQAAIRGEEDLRELLAAPRPERAPAQRRTKGAAAPVPAQVAA
jgi:hypothetical protein